MSRQRRAISLLLYFDPFPFSPNFIWRCIHVPPSTSLFYTYTVQFLQGFLAVHFLLRAAAKFSQMAEEVDFRGLLRMLLSLFVVKSARKKKRNVCGSDNKRDFVRKEWGTSMLK